MTNNIAQDALPARPMTAYIPDAGLSGVSEEYLSRRFMRPERQPDRVVYELTRDPGLLHQYYMLREEMFISVWGLQHASGQKDNFDDHSEIMVARIGNHCIGGGRLTFSGPSRREKLPMEKDGLSLAKLLPELPLSEVDYVEISRMVVLPEFQNGLVMLELSRALLKCAAEKKARYAFTLAPVPLAHNYRKAAQLFGLKWQIRNDISIPEREEDEGARMVLSMLDLAPLDRQIKARRPKAKAEDRALLPAT